MEKNTDSAPDRAVADTSSAQTLVLGLMTKYWTPGLVKTRLGAEISMQKAAQLHKLFVCYLTEALAESANVRSLVATPSESANLFASEIPPAWTIQLQSSGDLGCRMQHWFSQNLSNHPPSNHHSAVLIGADCPTLNASTIDEASLALADHDVVLGPAADGGYYLIGLRGPWQEKYNSLFCDIHWSSDGVFETTCQRIEAAGLSLATLSICEDIDTINELNRLRKSLAELGDTNQLAQQIEVILSGEPISETPGS